MARSGVSPYRAIEDRRAKWEKDHPREARIWWWVRYYSARLRQWEPVVAWTDRVCAKTGRGYAPEYHDLVRKLEHCRRMKGAWELKLKEVAE
jgi:hypothetical protein